MLFVDGLLFGVVYCLSCVASCCCCLLISICVGVCRLSFGVVCFVCCVVCCLLWFVACCALLLVVFFCLWLFVVPFLVDCCMLLDRCVCVLCVVRVFLFLFFFCVLSCSLLVLCC